MKLSSLETAEEQLELAQRCYEMGYRVAGMENKAGEIVNLGSLETARRSHRELLTHLVDLKAEENRERAYELYRTNFTEGYMYWMRLRTAAITDLDGGDQMLVFHDPLSHTFGYQLNLLESYGTYPDDPVTGFENSDSAEHAARERYNTEFKHRERTT